VLCSGLTHELQDGNWITTARFGAPALSSSSGAALELTDRNGNRIALDADGITLDSPKNIRLAAGRRQRRVRGAARRHRSRLGNGAHWRSICGAHG
jgi:hypothetical protein